MIERLTYLKQLETALGRSPITALLGPRQCGKTTLARQLAETRKATVFDLDSEPDVRRLANPELVLGELDGLVVFGHPRVGASWEGFAIEQILRALRCRDAWFWARTGAASWI